MPLAEAGLVTESRQPYQPNLNSPEVADQEYSVENSNTRVANGPALSRSLHFDQFDRDTVGPFDHRRAHRAPGMDVFGHLHAFALQPRDSRVEVRHTQCEVIHDLSAGADKRAVTRANQNRNHIAYGNGAGGIAYHTDFVECRPRDCFIRSLAVRACAACAGGRTHTEMRHVPFGRAGRVLVKHVNMIEVLRRREVSGILDQGSIRAPEILKSSN